MDDLKERRSGYPKAKLGAQQRPFDEAFSGFEMLRAKFGKHARRALEERNG